jgi:V-type H+-transporting ATPase subunit a
MTDYNPLKGADDVSLIQVYKQFINKEKTIYRTLNTFAERNALLVGLVWIPTKYEADFFSKKNEMSRAKNLNPVIIPRDRETYPELVRPTYFENNGFTSIFQVVVDTYGVPMYQECNPALFTCVTFPFLFGVMFGDIMHGSMLLAFGIYIVMASPTPGSLVSMFHPIRYFLLLMGFFATFCGFIYNDYTSIPLYIFGESCYVYTEGVAEPTLKPDCVYPFGVDPSWYLSNNELTYMNSMKMKIAVIFGVAQMSLGIVMKGFNALHAHSKIDFFFEFVPQIVMLLALFGFMDLMIIVKWMTDFSGEASSTAPSIITNMIDMCLALGVSSAPGAAPLIGTAEQQTKLMITLLEITMVCVPLMLCVKPGYIAMTMKSHKVIDEDSEFIQPSVNDDNFQQADQITAQGKEDDIFNLREHVK